MSTLVLIATPVLFVLAYRAARYLARVGVRRDARRCRRCRVWLAGRS